MTTATPRAVRSDDERSRETAADKRLYVEVGLTPVHCDRCGIEALVKKNSPAHTSVQWTPGSAARCPVLAEARERRPRGPVVPVLGCPDLMASIDEAVARGRLTVLDG